MSKLASLLTATKSLSGAPSLTGTDSTESTSLLNDAFNLFGRGADIYSQIAGKNTAVSPSGLVAQPKPTAATLAGTDWKKYLPWIAGGGVLLVVLYFVFRQR